MASKALKFVTKDGIGRGLREAGARLKESSELMEVRVLYRLHVACVDTQGYAIYIGPVTEILYLF